MLFQKPEDASLAKISSGDFMSINSNTIEERITNITGEQFSERERAAFKKIRNHRNKIIHFYDKDFNKDFFEKVVMEELCLWYYLHKRLTIDWKSIFKKYQRRIEKIKRKMRLVRRFLEAKYKEIQPEITKKIQKGAEFIDCHFCGYTAGEITATHESEHGDIVKYATCRVCEWVNSLFYAKCRACGVISLWVQDSDNICHKCGEDIDMADIIDSYEYYDRDSGGTNLAYCGYCEHHEKCVVPFNEGFLCMNCFELSSDIDVCGWCNESILGGAGDNSYYNGCFMCDGWSGYHGDKD